MRSIIFIIIFAIGATLLLGCGQYGKLYLPEKMTIPNHDNESA